MDATDQTPSHLIQTLDQSIPPTDQVKRPRRDRLALLGDSPLGVPVRQLWEGLDMLVQDGPLQGVELDVTHPDVPCFLLDVAPGLPRLYVELFLDETADTAPVDQAQTGDPCEDYDGPLLVLMNCLGENTDPVMFELDLSQPDFSSVLSHVQEMATARC